MTWISNGGIEMSHRVLQQLFNKDYNNWEVTLYEWEETTRRDRDDIYCIHSFQLVGRREGIRYILFTKKVEIKVDNYTTALIQKNRLDFIREVLDGAIFNIPGGLIHKAQQRDLSFTKISIWQMFLNLFKRKTDDTGAR